MNFCVIGVGRFGFHVSTTLANHGMDVMVVDSNENTISSIRDKVTQAICMRVTDEDSLRSIGIEEIETVIVAMGENFAQSILVTALLKQKLHVSWVIARAISTIHADILRLIGADEVILPEQAEGIRLADRLSLDFKALLRITPNFSINQVTVARKFIGKALHDCHFRETYHVTCIGKKNEDEIQPLDADYIFQENDILLFAGNNKHLEKFSRL